MVDNHYQDAVKALRETIDEYDEVEKEVAAKAADCYLEYLRGFLGEDVDMEQVARALFLAAVVQVMTRDATEAEVEHLLSEEMCEDESCELDHEDVSYEEINGLLDGLNAGIAATVGPALAVADLAHGFNWEEL